MGFPIPYAGVIPKLLLTAALSMAAIRDLCNAVLAAVGLSSYILIKDDHDNLFNNYQSDQSSPANDQQLHESWYYNNGDHELSPTPPPFMEALRSSLPVVLYEHLILNNPRPSSLSLLPSSSSSPSSSLLSSTSSPLHHGFSESAELAKIDHRHISSFSSSAPAIYDSNQDPAPLEHAQEVSGTDPIPPSSAGQMQPDYCAVCLCEFANEHEVRVLPWCHHIFHKDCIDGWLLHNHRTCPLCRTSLLTPAIALQEKLREQEISDQINSWFTSLHSEQEDAQEEEGEEEVAYVDLHHPHQFLAAADDHN